MVVHSKHSILGPVPNEMPDTAEHGHLSNKADQVNFA